MHSFSAFLAVRLSFSLFTSSAFAGSQNITIPGLSPCWQQCIDSSSGSNCDSSSLASYTSCICNLASQYFLTAAITCVQATCPSSLTTRLPLEILQVACTAAGSPIDSSALAAAESAESSAAVVSDYSYTTSSNGALYGAGPVTATEDVGSATAITVDGSSASAPGPSSTAEISSGTTATPVSLSSLSSSGAGVGASPSTSAARSTSTPAVPVTETGTTDATASRTATPSSSQATSHSNSGGADSAVKTEGAPLGMQGTGTKKDAGSVLGLTVWLIAGIVWF